MSIATFVKDPNAVLDYQLDWTPWLATDTITASVWTLPSGLTQQSASNTTTTATIWLSGGTAGVKYPVTNRVTTAGGRVDDRTITISVKER